MSLADLRKEYTLAGLDERDLSPDPVAQFERWFAEASASGAIEPSAMVLSTASAGGAPSSRVVLLKGVDARGFVFFTNYESRKGKDLAACPHVSLLFPWLALERQVIVLGEAEKTSREESEAYFASRPRGSQLGAWASSQSEVVSSRAALDARAREVEARFEGQDVPIPAHWGGFRVRPTEIELWQGRPSRLHDRLAYVREGDAWRIVRRQP